MDNHGESPWKQLLVVFNCSDSPCPVTLPEGKWQLLCDGDSSFRWQQHIPLEHRCTAQPGSALILGLL